MFKRKYYSSLFFIAFTIFVCLSCQERTKVVRESQSILIMTRDSTEERLANSPVIQAITHQANEKNIQLNTTHHPMGISQDSLLTYSAIVLFELILEELHPASQSRIERYLEAGGGVINVDNSLSMPYIWPWYENILALAQAHQKDSKDQGTDVVKVKSNAALGPYLQTNFHGGRVVFVEKGITNLSKEEFQQFTQEAVTYAIGKNTYDWSHINSPEAPEDNRFTRIVLDDYDINEPMELAVLPDGKVLFIERRGKMKLYNPESKTSEVIANFDVCTEGNYEDGLLGLALDPNFDQNHYLYLYYSPPCETWSQYLSRFTMHGTDSIILESEKVVLEVPVQRETCCHSGGSITFDAEGNLYLSTGDNTSSKESNGFSPLDERPGRGPFDAQKSSGNTNDLRGKVLRIKPTEFGTYTIPEGNLFPKDSAKGRPEIYVMGARNPFRISVDAKTGFLYWGDVGPDVAKPGKYGPESFDEWNQARSAGNYGWPYFIGNNYAYPSRDFEADTIGPLFDPKKPQNYSPNNTGYHNLPPARPAFIWYPKRNFEEFPMLDQGSNSAMAGPIYYSDLMGTNSRVQFPEYYNGKLFIYEWARSWMKVVTMDENGDLVKIEPFLQHENIVKPIDMEFGPDGAMYMLEYGQNYFMNNPEAKLTKIEYAAGNRLPVPIIQISSNEGSTPHTIQVSAEESYDYDLTDELTFKWYFSDTTQVQATGPEATFTFSQPGVHRVRLEATDTAGESEFAEVEVRVGNEPPQIDINFAGNQEFFLNRENRSYSIDIQDKEDLANGGIDPNQLAVNFIYVPEGEDLEVMLGSPHSAITGSLRFAKGQKLIKNSDCTSCHNLKQKNVGPAYYEVSQKYKDDPKALTYLANKIITGGNGVWGEKIMPGHPQHSLSETKEMSAYILSLADDRYTGQLPTSGTIMTNQHKQSERSGKYLIAATYQDKGANGLPSITRRKIKYLRAPYVEAEDFLESGQVQTNTFGSARENTSINGIKHKSYVKFPETDLTDISHIQFQLKPLAGGTLFIFLEESDGTLLGKVNIPAGGPNADWRILQSEIIPIVGKHKLFIEFRRPGSERAIAEWDWMKFKGKGGRIVF